MKDNRLLITCPRCGKEYKSLVPIRDDKGNMIGMVCKKCVRELTGGAK